MDNAARFLNGQRCHGRRRYLMEMVRTARVCWKASRGLCNSGACSRARISTGSRLACSTMARSCRTEATNCHQVPGTWEVELMTRCTAPSRRGNCCGYCQIPATVGRVNREQLQLSRDYVTPTTASRTEGGNRRQRRRGRHRLLTGRGGRGERTLLIALTKNTIIEGVRG